MANVLDPTVALNNGDNFWFKCENNASDVIQGYQYEHRITESEPLGIYGGVLATQNVWGNSAKGVYFKVTSGSSSPTKINGVTLPNTNANDFSAIPKSWWYSTQGMIDGYDILDASFPTYDHLPHLNDGQTYPTSYYINGSIVACGEYRGQQWASQHNIGVIGVGGTGDFIWAYSGGEYGITLDMAYEPTRSYRLIAVMRDKVDGSDNVIARNIYWCFIDTNGVVKDSIKWVGGTFYDSDPDEEGDPMLEPDLPSLDITDTGMCKMYLFESSSEINALLALSEFLWSDDFFDNLVKTVDNPMDAIISFNGVPCASALSTGSSRQVAVGNLFVANCNARIVTKQYYRVDCGSLSIPATHGNYLDYEPFTEIRLFLPFIGFVSLSTADAVGKTLDIVYHCDIITGQCVAYIKDGTSGNVLYTYNGNTLQNLPMTGRNLPNMLTGILSASGIPTDMSKGLSIGNAISSGVQGVQGQYTRGGGINCTSGLMAPQRPYAIVTRRVPIVDANYNTYVGKPYFKTAQLSSVSGFTIVEQAQLTGVIATQSELEEIDTLLKGGVIL